MTLDQLILDGFLIVGTLASAKYLLTPRPTVSQHIQYDDRPLMAEIDDVFTAQNRRIREIYVQCGQMQIALSQLLQAFGVDVDDDSDDTQSRH